MPPRPAPPAGPDPADAEFIVARGFWWLLLISVGARAITMPWRRIHVLEAHMDDAILRRHELIHIEQIDRDGPVRFTLKYLWWLARYGYWKNPYEVEAYARERD